MKLIRPTPPTLSTEGGRSHRKRPVWLKEWLEDQPRYVELSCGDRLNINGRSVTVIKGFDSIEIYCERHNRFAHVDKTMTTREYLEIEATVTPEIPLF